jgi:hypothetical protein
MYVVVVSWCEQAVWVGGWVATLCLWGGVGREK